VCVDGGHRALWTTGDAGLAETAGLGMGDPVGILQRVGGSARFADLSGLTTAWSIRTALERGEIRRVAKGVYALPEAASDLTIARANGGILSRESAALHYGFQSSPDHCCLT
jgi:hypothetical protein